jgi:hypothetical protein
MSYSIKAGALIGGVFFLLLGVIQGMLEVPRDFEPHLQIVIIVEIGVLSSLFGVVIGMPGGALLFLVKGFLRRYRRDRSPRR